MTSIIKKYLICLAALSLLAACGKEPVKPAPQTGATISYRATVSEGVGTRAGLNGSQQYVFSEGDQLYVFVKVGETVSMYGRLDMLSGENQTTATFEGDLTCVGTFVPKDDTILSAVLVSADALSSGFYTFTASGLLQGPTYPTNAFATSFADAVSKYGVFTASSTYGESDFKLNQQSAFLIFNIELDSTASAVVSATIDSKTGDRRTADVPVATRGAKKVASFVSAYPASTTFTEGTITVNDEEYDKKINASLAANKYYYVTRVKTAFEGFFIKAKEDNTTVTLNQYFRSNKDNDGSLVQYSLSEGLDWNDFTNSTQPIKLNTGETICLRAYRTNFSGYKNTNENAGYYLFHADKLCYIGGDIMSLLCTDLTLSEFRTTAPANAFNSLFKFATWIDIDPVKPLRLTATVLGTDGEKKNHYKSMFHGCSGLTRAPEMAPVTTLQEGCYFAMFKKCANLEVAPDLPAPTLVKDCYNGMFHTCSKLRYIKCLATNISATSCLENWLNYAKNDASCIFVKAEAMTSWPRTVSGIPSNWTVVDDQ